MWCHVHLLPTCELSFRLDMPIHLDDAALALPPHTGLSLLTSLHTLELCCIASSSSSPPSLVAEELDPDTAWPSTLALPHSLNRAAALTSAFSTTFSPNGGEHYRRLNWPSLSLSLPLLGCVLLIYSLHLQLTLKLVNCKRQNMLMMCT